eukprot:3163882-Pyramimonas_sp.AAC.1
MQFRKSTVGHRATNESSSKAACILITISTLPSPAGRPRVAYSASTAWCRPLLMMRGPHHVCITILNQHVGMPTLKHL